MSENRTFKMHPALLYSVIQSQAGTLAKGILESVMNSIDAGASKVEITLTELTYKVSDDGKGFSSRNEIESFFETFGTPHVEGDATYGRFRIGRGQGFAFAINTWRTGNFEMHVDIKNKGLDYTLKDNLEHQPGCVIFGELYDKLAPTELLSAQRALIEQCLYTPVPVILNGKQISKDAKKEKWDHETEDAYIKLMSKNTMAIYNLGILVSNFNAYEFGTGGIVVSKKQLDLNFARNDIMRNSCKVWKRIKPFLRNLSDKASRKSTRVTEEWRQMKAQEFLGALTANTDRNYLYDLLKAPVFTDISGKHFSFHQLSRQTGLSVSKRGDFQADKVSQTKVALVLDQDLVHSRFGVEFEDLIKFIHERAIENNLWFRNYIVNIREVYKPIDFYTKSFDSEHLILEESSLNKKEQLALKCINNISYNLLMLVSREGKEANVRRILPMKSEVAWAFTDGTQTIWIHKYFLSGWASPDRGYSWATHVVNILIHEYCHDFNSGVGHTHDSEFYQLFHDTVTEPNGVGSAAELLLRDYIKGASALTRRLSKNVGFNADQMHRAEEVETKLNKQMQLVIDYRK